MGSALITMFVLHVTFFSLFLSLFLQWKGMDQTSPYASPALAPLSPPKMGLPAQLHAGAEAKGAKAAAAAFDPDSERKQAETSGGKQ